MSLACAMMLDSPPHRRVVCPGPTFAFPRCGYPCGTALSPRFSRYGCSWLVPLHSLTPPVWCGSTVHNTRLPAQMFCDAPCHVQSLLACSRLSSWLHGLVMCRGGSSGRSRSSSWYAPSSSSHQLGHFVHLLCSVCRIRHSFRSFQPRSINTRQCVVVWCLVARMWVLVVTVWCSWVGFSGQ